MMEGRSQHRCRFCFRSFGSGRALGGHMRSHMLKFSSSSRQEYREDDGEEEEEPLSDHFQSLNSYSLSSSSSSDEDAEMEELSKGNYSRKSREDVVEFSSDRESETESRPIARRSKRVRRSRVSDEDHSSLMESSVSDTTPEEHVAYCLIMLSRDTWARHQNIPEINQEKTVIRTTKVRGKYRCETCSKQFRSYQALGGHRASHNKQGVKVHTIVNTRRPDPTAAADEEKRHVCPFCLRVFSSGQALGGHKRSHFTASSSATEPRILKPGPGIGNIDLNLPAPADDDDNSQIAVSALSEAEFVN